MKKEDLIKKKNHFFGVFKTEDGTFIALAPTISKEFKTRKGAKRWIDKNAPGWG